MRDLLSSELEHVYGAGGKGRGGGKCRSRCGSSGSRGKGSRGSHSRGSRGKKSKSKGRGSRCW